MHKRERTARSRPGPKRIEFARTNNIERQNSRDMIREFITEHSCTLGKKSLWSVAHRKYKQMDADGNGTLDRDEFASLIADGNETLDRDELASLMKELNSSKTVSEDEVDDFVNLMFLRMVGLSAMRWIRCFTIGKATLRACLKLCLYLTSTTSIVLGASSGTNSEYYYLT